MKELARTNDPIFLSFLQALLGDASIESTVMDQHTSVIEGSIGALPRRLMVADEDYERAARVLDEARAEFDGHD